MATLSLQSWRQLTCFKKPSSPTAFSSPLTSMDPSLNIYNGRPSVIQQVNSENNQHTRWTFGSHTWLHHVRSRKGRFGVMGSGRMSAWYEMTVNNRPWSDGGHFESQENKKLCFCPCSLALDERWDGQSLLFQHCMIKVYRANLSLSANVDIL